MVFDEAYYASDLAKADYSHYALRADWVVDKYGGKRVIELGCSFGQIIKALRDIGIVAWGVDGSQYAIDNTDALGFVFHSSAQDFGNQLKKQDFVVSWNFLDCLNDEAEALLIATELEAADENYHVICIDDGSIQAQDYIDKGYFIKPISYWLGIMPSDAVLIEYHSRIVHNYTGDLLMPLSWDFISM